MASNVNEILNELRDSEYVTSSSENQILIVVLVLVVIILISVSLFKKKFDGLPPGPTGLPLIGYLPFLSRNPHLDLIKLGKKYGNVFSLTLGTETVIVLHGVNAIKEALAKPEFFGRPPHSIVSWLSPNSPFFALDVHVWKEQRPFVVETMKALGLGKSRIEEEVENEVRHFLDVLRSHKGAPIDVKDPLTPSMSNNICTLVFGKRYEYDDTDRLDMDSNMEDAFAYGISAILSTFLPWIRFIPFITKLLGIEKGITAGRNGIEICRRQIENHRKTFNPSNVRDYIDGYLKEMESKKNDPRTSFNEDIFIGSLIDLVVAGTETVRTSILWGIYAMATYPEVQRKVQREISEVLGPDRCPEFLDQRRLPYTHAVILEVSRWKTIVPMNVRYTTRDTTVAGHHIPGNTIVVLNYWAVHNDPSLWKDPDTFKPERFLSPDGTSVVQSSNLMPYSIGKRSCPGETMANMELFLYFASMLREFDIRFPDEGITPTINANLAISYRLDPFKVRLIERK